MVVELIVKDKNEKLQFKGKCRLRINSVSKLLLVKPFFKKFKVISTIFKWKFIAEKNILFVLAKNESNNFALIFDELNKCNEVYNFLCKHGATAGKKEIISQHIFSSFFKEIALKKEGSVTEILCKWNKKHTKYKNVYDAFNSCDTVSQENKKSRKRKANDIKYENEIDVQSHDDEGINIKSRFIKSKCDNKNFERKRLQIQDPQISKNIVKAPYFMMSCEYNPEKHEIVETSNFKIFEYMHKGKMSSKLIVFCPTNKNLCYEYYWTKKNYLYRCSYCAFEKQVTATIFKDEKSHQKLMLSKTEHVCDLREFDSKKYTNDIMVDKSMYKITSSVLRQIKNKILIFFTNKEKNFCYKFGYDLKEKCYYCSRCLLSKIRIAAVIQNEGKENECAFVSNQEHVCKPFEYSTITNGNIIQAPNYQLVKRKANGKIIQRLAVFINEQNTECFEYTWMEKPKHFVCNRCQYHYKTHVYAQIFKNNKSEECVELSLTAHKCKPIKFVPEIITPKIVKQPDFKLYEITWSNRSVKRLAIFNSKNKTRGYIYTYHQDRNCYVCSRCTRKKKYVTAKVVQAEDGQTYVELNETEHACKIQQI